MIQLQLQLQQYILLLEKIFTTQMNRMRTRNKQNNKL